MASVTLTGKDVIKIDGRLITALAAGDCGKVEFPEKIGQVKVSKDGGAVYTLVSSGLMAHLTLLVLRGSADDKYLRARLQEFKNDPSNFILVQGLISKRIGDGKGNITTDVYQCDDGIFDQQPGVLVNTEGAPEQGHVEYMITFRNGGSALQ